MFLARKVTRDEVRFPHSDHAVLGLAARTPHLVIPAKACPRGRAGSGKLDDPAQGLEQGRHRLQVGLDSVDPPGRPTEVAQPL